MTETRCALEEIEQNNDDLTGRNAKLEQTVARLKQELTDKSRQADAIQAAFERGQSEKNRYCSGQADALERKVAALKQQSDD
jgi:uncharacterized small protein (DUF1192 family)